MTLYAPKINYDFLVNRVHTLRLTLSTKNMLSKNATAENS